MITCTPTTRTAAFLLACIPLRIAATLAARHPANRRYLPHMGVVALLIGLGFATIYVFDLRRTGRETCGEQIWWNSLRPLHAALYFAFAYAAIAHKHDRAWMALAADVVVGLLAFLSMRPSL